MPLRFALPLLALLFTACTHAPPASTRQDARKRVRLLQVADTHAQLETHLEYLPGETPELQRRGGYARVKAVLDRERAAFDGATFSADAGDTFQGSGAAAWTEGEAVLAPFNALGMDVCVPGNWEVVYGPGRFRNLMSRLTCDVLSYNFHDTTTGQRLFAPAKVLTRGGVKVAFVGITDPTTSLRQPPAQVAGLDTTRMAGLRDYVRELKAREQPDLVVAVTHTGLTVSRQLAKDVPELDVILSGHTHERSEAEAVEGRTIIVEPGSMGSFVGELDLTVGKSGVTAHRWELLPVTPDLKEDAQVKALVDASLAPHRARLNQVVGRTTTPILRYDVLETSADDLVADAVKEIGGADVGATNGFRFGVPIAPGPVTVGDLWNLLPLDANVKRGWVTGAQLRAYLERELELVFSRDANKLSGGWGPRLAGLTMRYRAGAPAGQRVEEVRVGGKPLADSDKVSLAGCEREGEKVDVVCRLAGVHDAEVSPLTIHTALEKYFAKHPVVSPSREQRSVAVDLPAKVFSQDAVLQAWREK